MPEYTDEDLCPMCGRLWEDCTCGEDEDDPDEEEEFA